MSPKPWPLCGDDGALSVSLIVVVFVLFLSSSSYRASTGGPAPPEPDSRPSPSPDVHDVPMYTYSTAIVQLLPPLCRNATGYSGLRTRIPGHPYHLLRVDSARIPCNGTRPPTHSRRPQAASHQSRHRACVCAGVRVSVCASVCVHRRTWPMRTPVGCFMRACARACKRMCRPVAMAQSALGGRTC